MSDHSSEGVVDVVVGAASGMGAAVARRLAAAAGSGSGRRLLLADLDVAGVEDLAAELGAGAEAHRCDLTSADDLASLVGAVTPGALGALVLTAGLSPTMAPGRRILEVDLVAPAHLVAAFGEVATVGTAALLFASMAGHLVPPDPGIDAALATPRAPGFLDDLAAAGVDVDDPGAAYAYAKRGLRSLVAREAAAWGRRGARLLSLSPGVIDTPMGRQENEAQPLMAAMVEGSALGRMITAEEVAAVAAFLVGDAAGVLTGTDVLVDGGAVAALLHPSA